MGQPGPGKDGEADSQPIIDASVHEKYVGLLCKYNIAGVAQHVKNNEGYRLQETLDVGCTFTSYVVRCFDLRIVGDSFQICRTYQAMDAVAFLLEKAGDVQGAFKIMLEVSSSLIDVNNAFQRLRSGFV